MTRSWSSHGGAVQAALCAHSMTEDDLRALVLRRRVARSVALPPRSTATGAGCHPPRRDGLEADLDATRQLDARLGHVVLLGQELRILLPRFPCLPACVSR